MSLLVVGSVAFDAVETPFGKRDRMLGGSASHFSISASFFTDVRVVAVVGGDFGQVEKDVFARHNIDTSDLTSLAAASPVGALEPEMPEAHGMENILIEELELGVRSYNCLKRVGIETIGDLISKTEQELAAIPNFGKKSIEEVRETLAVHSLKLRGDD